MIASKDPSTWTEEYVQSHLEECLPFLHSLNQQIMYEILEGRDYGPAAAGISRLRRGLGFLHAIGCCGDLAESLVECAMAEGLLLVFGEPSKFRSSTDRERRKPALDAFEFAWSLGKGRAQTKEAADLCLPFISALKAGTPLAQIRQDCAGMFPNAIDTVLVTLHSFKWLGDFSAPEKTAPDWKRFGLLGGLLLLLLVAAAAFAWFIHVHDSGEPDSAAEVSAAEAPGVEREEGLVFPNSGTELIDQEKIHSLSDSDLTYAIYEIYARHGYIFQNRELRRYYEQFSWYDGDTPAEEFSVYCFNLIEQQNWSHFLQERNSRKAAG